jgi:hypothetical protein
MKAGVTADSRPHLGRVDRDRGAASPWRRAARLVLLLCGVVLSAMAGWQSAEATVWSIQPVPQPAHLTDPGLSGVSCTSRMDCVAVGSADNPSTENALPLVERWHGSTWSIARTPRPPTPDWYGWLSSVSCTSRRSCMAVGTWGNNAGNGGLAERGSGASWSILRTPNRPADEGSFSGVSCTSSSDCLAVGSGDAAGAARWNGTRWSAMSVPAGDPQDGANALERVSCITPSTCAAVGWDDIGLCSDPYESDYTLSILGFRTAGRWSLRDYPNIRCPNSQNGNGNTLDAVSCASASACTAVGTEVYRWDGHQWSLQPAPLAGDKLFGVACPSSDVCTALGSHIYTSTAGGWSSIPIPTPSGGHAARLSSVSCLSPRACVAVGEYRDNHQRWRLLAEATGF